MTKSEYIEYWRLTAEKDWVAVGHLFEKGDYLHALFLHIWFWKNYLKRTM